MHRTVHQPSSTLTTKIGSQITPITNYLLTYFTPCSRELLEKLIGSQLVKKFPAFYGTRRFITAFTNARHLCLSSAQLHPSIHPHPTSSRSTLILPSHLHLGLPSGLFPSGSPPKHYIRLSSDPYALHAPPISFFSIFITRTIMREGYSQDIVRVQSGYSQGTVRVQSGYSQGTVRVQSGCSQGVVRVQSE